MIYVTSPIAVTSHDVWVFGDIGATILACRVAICDKNGTLLAFPSDDFATEGAMPTYPNTGQLIPGLRWATTEDIDNCPGVFERHGKGA